MTKIVVIGSNSFSGQDFVDLLLDDPAHDVIGISRSKEKNPFFLRYKERDDLSRFRFHRMDMNTDMDALLALLDAEKPEYIVNFAAQSEVGPSWDHPEHWFQTNTVALARFVNHMRRHDYLKKYLHISSPEAYGNCVGTVTEETPDNPSTPYAVSKAAADMLLAVYCKEFGFPLVTVRATNVYGPRQQLFKIICRTIIYLKSGRVVPLHGGGNAIKSWINIRDVSKGELLILKKGTLGHRYHLSPAQAFSVREAVQKICTLMGKNIDNDCEDVEERTGQDAIYFIDSSKAQRQFGWQPEINIEDGLSEVVDWIEANWSEIEMQPLEYLHKP